MTILRRPAMGQRGASGMYRRTVRESERQGTREWNFYFDTGTRASVYYKFPVAVFCPLVLPVV